jgi:hypothetical protein
MIKILIGICIGVWIGVQYTEEIRNLLQMIT